MTTKVAILASMGAFIVVMGLGFLVAFLTIDLQAPGAEERFGKVGGATGFLAMLPLAGIWIKWGMSRGDRRTSSKKKRSSSTRRSQSDE